MKIDALEKRREKLKYEIGTKNNMDKVMQSIIQKNLDKRSKNMTMDKIEFFHDQYKKDKECDKKEFAFGTDITHF